LKRSALISVICILIGFSLVPWGFAADEVILVGEVNDNFQLYADGKIYEVAETPVGNDMVKHYISEKVEVHGSVEQIDDYLVLTVRSFKVVPE
jgi:hypothetical protein